MKEPRWLEPLIEELCSCIVSLGEIAWQIEPIGTGEIVVHIEPHVDDGGRFQNLALDVSEIISVLEDRRAKSPAIVVTSYSITVATTIARRNVAFIFFYEPHIGEHDAHVDEEVEVLH